jgi:hypothetical protein
VGMEETWNDPDRGNKNTRRKTSPCITSLEMRFKNPFYIVYNVDILYLHNFTFLYCNTLS